ncbi:MAG: hypothetical protein PHF26_01795 [Candidatus Gracilibacteria bacterium]|nr:hypothetical protein [Candidatus Gracilibacteria bacterium]
MRFFVKKSWQSKFAFLATVDCHVVPPRNDGKFQIKLRMVALIKLYYLTI